MENWSIQTTLQCMYILGLCARNKSIIRQNYSIVDLNLQVISILFSDLFLTALGLNGICFSVIGLSLPL